MLFLGLILGASLPAQDDASEEARRLYDQSRTLFQQGKYAEGLPLAQRVLDLRERALGREHLDTAAALVNLANFHAVTRTAADSESLYRRALAIREQQLGPEHPDTVTTLNNLANYYRLNEMPARALPLYTRVLTIREKVLGPEHPDTSAILTNLGNIHYLLANFKQASRFHQRVLALNEKIFGPDHPRTALALSDLAIARGALGEYSMQVKLLQRALAIQTQAVNSSPVETARLIKNLALPYKKLGAYAQAESLYQRSIALVEQASGPQHPLIAETALNLGSLYQATGAYDKSEAILRRGLAIAETSLGPESSLVAEILNSMGSAYGRQSAQASLSSNPVVMADPDFGQRERVAAIARESVQQRSEEMDRGGGLSFRALPGAAAEAVAIKNLLQGENARLLTGAAASEINLKQLHGPRILHLATHGFFLSDQQARTANSVAATPLPGDFLAENPLLRSGLALAGANERRSGFNDDGILTALEASRLDLHGTELVVLSACETGVGEVRNGDGITGLRRALLLAGAQTQVASLWKVADLPTKELMVGFYQNLVQRAGRSAALRRAQLAMLANPQQSHPYYWASFVAVGDWRPLPAAN